MIEIKSLFYGWKEVDKETAKNFTKGLLNGITTMALDEKIKYIENNRLRGITVKELLEGEKWIS